MLHFKRYIIPILGILLYISGCTINTAPQSSNHESQQRTEIQAPEPSDVILTLNDIDIPYSLYQHYYNAMAMQMDRDNKTEWTSAQLQELKEHTQELLLDDCVYQLLAQSQDIALSDKEKGIIAEAVNKLNPVSDSLRQLQQFRMESAALKDKIYITLYTPDFLQSAVHVQSLFIPYADASKKEADSKKQLASLITALCNSEDKSLKALSESMYSLSDSVLQELYLTRGDMGQGTYELASGLAENEVSQAFTLDNNGVYLLQRLPIDEAYIQEHINELLENSTEFSTLYQMLVSTVRQTANISYTDYFERIPSPNNSNP